MQEIQNQKSAKFETQFKSLKDELVEIRKTVVQKVQKAQEQEEVSMLSSEVEGNDQFFEQQVRQLKQRTQTLSPNNLKNFASFKGELGKLRKTIINLPA
jgi:hypothetical protein